MFCPECRAEYREGFTECSDCGLPLVRELSPEPKREYVEFVTVLSGNLLRFNILLKMKVYPTPLCLVKFRLQSIMNKRQESF